MEGTSKTVFKQPSHLLLFVALVYN